MSPHISESTFLDHRVLHFNGEFDVSTHELLWAALDRVADLPDGRVLLDLSAVTFLDCGAVRQLDAIAGSRQPEPVTVCPEGRVLRLLRMTGYGVRHRVASTLTHAITTRPCDPVAEARHRTVRVVPPAPRRGSRRNGEFGGG